MIDIERLKKYAKEIRENIRLIEEYTGSKEGFFSDRRNVLSVKHLLLQSIESCAIICNHISSKFGKVAPSGYTECFRNLGDIGIFDDKFVKKLVSMVRFRNILVHEYIKVDDSKVLQFAQNNIIDFDEFLRGVFDFLKESEII